MKEIQELLFESTMRLEYYTDPKCTLTREDMIGELKQWILVNLIKAHNIAAEEMIIHDGDMIVKHL